MNHQSLKESLADLLGISADFSLDPCNGGESHRSFHLLSRAKNESYFVKVNSVKHAPVLESEGESLRIMGDLFPGAYPSLIATAKTSDLAILVMSYHQLNPLNKHAAADAGELLAQQHTIQNTKCGWHSDNFIGLSPQKNDWMESWAEFFLYCRLRPQLLMAQKNALPHSAARAVESLIESPPQAFAQHKPNFALLHGDLWSGNVGYDRTRAQGLLFDPAPYYGDPEVDLAMSEMFGRFPAEFYVKYYNRLPKKPDYAIRRNLYNLYHALNHFNLFGENFLTLVEDYLRCLNLDIQFV